MPVVNEIKLNQNTITSALFNMIISQHIFDSKVASTDVADMFRVDGTLYGDTKLYQSFDIGSLEDWLNDGEAQDLLKLNRNKSGKTQTIKMGVYKLISITTDRYLSKQAFMNDGTFSEYTSFLTGSLRKIKKVYDRSLINVKIGTLTPSTTACDITVVTPNGDTIEETNRLEAQTIAQQMVILKANLEDNNRIYNSFDYLRSYDSNDFIAFWNVEKHAKITELDLPTIFHKDIKGQIGFRQIDLPAKWFGTPASVDRTLGSGESATSRILESSWYKVANVTGDFIEKVSKPDNDSVFLWAGDSIPYTGKVYKDYARDKTVTVTATKIKKEHYYVLDTDVDFVLVHKDSLPFMSGFETATEFWNGRSLTTNDYLIFGHNELEYLEEYPRIRVKVVKATSTSAKSSK